MKKGVEIIPEENYRLRNEDNFQAAAKDFGSKTGSMASVSTDHSSLSSYQKELPDGYSEVHGFREASQTLYARAGDKKVGL